VKNDRNRRVNLLSYAGKSEEALALAKSLATEFPIDAGLQHQYAQRLAQTGDTDAALAWLDAALGRKWDGSQADLLRELKSDLLRNQMRFIEQAEFVAKWIEAKPGTETPYAHYLTALVRSNRAAKAEELVAQWLINGRVHGEMPRSLRAMLNAALQFAQGQAFQIYSNRIDERWHTALAETALFFARIEDGESFASSILNDHRFNKTDACKAVKKTLGREFLLGIATFRPDRLTTMINWVWSDDALTTEEWQKIVVELRKRWDAEKDTEIKHQLGQGLIQVLHRFIGDSDLQFLRVQFQTAPVAHRTEYANAYFQALIVRPWTTELETELFKLLDALPPIEEPGNGLVTRVQTLHRLTDAMVEARYQAAFKKVEHTEKFTRTELSKKQTELRKLAREGFAGRLKAETALQPKPFAAWLTVERHWLEMQLERNLPQIAAELWPILDPAIAVVVDADDDNSVLLGTVDAALRNRARAELANLAARKGADPKLVERFTKLLEGQIAAHPDELRWKQEKFDLLIALDQPKELEAELRRWIAQPDSINRWRLALGRLLAEQGKVAEAIPLFEAVQAADELGPDEYRTLAEWYQIENRRELSEKAKAAQYKVTDENLLFNQLNHQLSRLQRAGGRSTTTVDAEVLDLLRAYFEKSQAPHQALNTLSGFYKSTRDFRLLAVLPDGIVGHSAGAIYPFLQTLRSLLTEIRDEATADELAQRIAEVRKLRTTAVDLRALDLLEVQVERRAAELQNQPGPHADKAFTALKRAFTRDQADGEPRWIAEFLAELGDVKDITLAKEQRSQLETLHRIAKPGTFDRLQISKCLSDVQSWSGQLPRALDTLEAALNEFETARSGKLPNSANEILERFIGRLETAQQFERGEKYLRNQLTHPIHAEQRNWLTRRWNQLNLVALRNNGTVSLGKGETLYKALTAKIIADIGATRLGQRYPLLAQLASTYRIGHQLAFAGAVGDLQAFAFETLPALLKDDTEQYADTITEFSEALRSLSGPQLAISFLLERAENSPDSVRYSQRQTPWQQYCDRLGRWRTEVKVLGDIEPRLLKFVEAELRRDLRSRDSVNRSIYSRHNSHFWIEKESAFAKVAEEVLTERQASSAAVEYIAEYFHSSLGREKRAIEILVAARADKRLSDSGIWQLIDYLHRSNRFAESIPHLVGLIERQPEQLAHRTKLMHAYFRTEQPVKLLELLKRTDTLFHEQDRWNEGTLAALAESTLENRLFAPSVAYCEELIPLHQRTSGDRALHRYYTIAANAYAGLGKTKEAVDRASAAVVLWPAGQSDRQVSLDQLVRILQNAPKLEEFIVELDGEKLQSAVVRMALGRAFIAKNEHARAIPQFRLAAELQPNDAEVYPLLVACFDKIGDQEGAVQQLYDAIGFTRQASSLYADLGKRLGELNRPAAAERANTTIVELQANESESHTLLAEIREKQNRWLEAIRHWERVAEIRKLEPTGLLKLAAAQIHEKQWNNAEASLRKLRTQTWPDRFPEVAKQTRELENLLELKPKY
jgi:tetratricopeptide (TPR) repeat protein